MKKALIAIVVCANMSVSLQAAVILQWTTFNGDGTNNPTAVIGGAGNTGAVGVIDANLNASSGTLSRGSSFGLSGYAWNPSNLFTTQDGASPVDLVGAISGNVYAAFTLTPSSGYQFSLDSIDFNIFSPQGPATSELLFSTDGFSSYTSVGSVSTGGGVNSTTANVTGVSALQNSTTATEFRVYFYGAGAFTLRGLDGQEGAVLPLSLQGSVTAVPEPTTCILMMVGGLVSAVVLRRPRDKFRLLS